jgi:hypothetical protein
MIRISKSAVNIREKLAELERPIGLKGSELMRAETAQDARDLVSAGRKNLVINGGMEISQRGTSAFNAVTDGGVVSCDQWKSWKNGGSGSGADFTLQQEFSVIPDNFMTSLKVNQTGAATLTGYNYNLVANYIEGYRIAHLGFGTSAAKTVTLSFWIRSSITGTFGGALSNGGQTRSYPFLYTIDNVNTWERKTITIPGDTTGTWTRDNSKGLLIFFSVGTGPSYSGPEGVWAGATYLSATGVSNWVGQSSTFYLTGVQLEVGKNATEFEHRSYGEELALCQRYYEKSYDIDIAPGSNIATNGRSAVYFSGTSDTSGNMITHVSFCTPKRSIPTITFYQNDGTLGVWNYNKSGTSGTVTMVTTQHGHRGFCPYANVGGNNISASFNGSWTAASEL